MLVDKKPVTFCFICKKTGFLLEPLKTGRLYGSRLDSADDDGLYCAVIGAVRHRAVGVASVF